MKKLVLGLVFTLCASVLFAQDMDPKKALKNASKLLTKYNLDGGSDISMLDEAIDVIKIAVEDEEYGKDAETWLTLGEIYSAYIEHDTKQSVLNPDYKPQYGSLSYSAYEAYEKAVKLAEKNRNSKKAIDNIASTISGMSNQGIAMFQNENYNGAYQMFSKVLDAHKLLKDNGASSPIDGEEEYNGQLYLTGLAALMKEDYDNASIYYNQLRERGYNEPDLYDGLVKIALQKDEEKAFEILSEGREKFPENLNLLYTEINYYLKKEKLDILEEKLKVGIEKDPMNPSLYTTLGTVYDRTFQNALKEGNKEKAQEYFDKAKDIYLKASEITPEASEPIYSIGALFYNKAAVESQALKELADDYSEEGLKKFDAKKAQIDRIFEQALPYFQKAERLNPNDRNTIIALKEIYARNNELEVSNEFKKRLERIEAGETIEQSYFK